MEHETQLSEENLLMSAQNPIFPSNFVHPPSKKDAATQTDTGKFRRSLQEFPFVCTQCSTRYRDVTSLNEHYLTAHPPVTEHFCNQCSSSFKFLSSYHRHVRYVHGGKVLTQDTSSASTSDAGHSPEQFSVHSGEKIFSCAKCSLRFLSEALLQKHAVLHLNEKPFKCGHCFARFKSNYLLKLHLNVHSDLRLFTCDHCLKKFKRKAYLRRHMILHFGSKNVFSARQNGHTYAKGMCKQTRVLAKQGTSLSRNSLSAKFNPETNLPQQVGLSFQYVNPFLGSICQIKFDEQDNLQGNCSRPKAEKLYPCDLCSVSYRQVGDLLAHISAAHPIV